MNKKRNVVLSPLNQADFPLVILEDLGMQYANIDSKTKIRMIMAECPLCEKPYRVSAANIKKGTSSKCRSCYDKNRSKKHGECNSKLYMVWSSMKARCTNPNSKDFPRYGGRGVMVCPEWNDNYKSFSLWAKSNGYREGLKIDRRNNDGIYEPNNCRWVTQEIQSRNTIKIMKTNTSGYRGVFLAKSTGKWNVYIGINKISTYIGTFKNKIDAAKAYDDYITNNKLEHTKNF